MVPTRRFIGALLLLAAFAPLHRLLDPGRSGPAGSATRAAAEAAWALGVSGTLIVMTFSWVCLRVVGSPSPWRASAARILERLEALSSTTFAIGVGILVTVLAASVAWFTFGGAPTSVDEMAQLLHASALASGRMGLPLPGTDAAWIIQNGIVTEAGWASIYPPAHTLLLAMGLRIGTAWLVGPVAIGAATALVILSAERVVGVGVARVAGLLLAVSPFWILIGATHLSHSTAALGLALVLWTGLRAQGGGLSRWMAVGGAVGLAVATRPWIGLATSTAILAALVFPPASRSPEPAPVWLTRFVAVGAGGAPFAALLFLWNAHLFQSPGRLGYEAAFGPSHGLGFGSDPWGNLYGPLEALAYTGADLSQLGVRLLESPLPLVAVIGAVLVWRPLREGVGVFGAWAGAAVLANAVYWHHGLHMGPRMLYESAPAWMVLFVAAATAVFGPTTGQATAEFRSTPRRLAAWSIVVTIVASLVLAPTTVRQVARTQWRATVPQPPTPEALVFVHGSWPSRVAARLAASGMRRDSIETALRRNDVCAVDHHARWRLDPAGASTEAPLDFAPLPGSPVTLGSRVLSPGNIVRVAAGAPHDPTCIREARADRLGVLELELLAWQYPPTAGARLVVARDLGPAANVPVLLSFPRPAYVLVDPGADGVPILLEYAEGMELLWGGAAGAIEGGGTSP
ncbi:MAG: glycosyltransferase family 39 protein [Gemmatimonadetes bacterium]|nr:glycosyltransferase family 39 protein [Gemmatimonadota bacterium]MDA1103781.1 glycosyltransferase family 39 protein [Gemmatimonadota bacterium]